MVLESHITKNSKLLKGEKKMFTDNESKMSRLHLQRLVIAVTLIMLFLVGCGNTNSTPASEEAQPVAPASTPVSEETKPEEGPHTGDIAPDFTLPDSNGNMVHLADELNDHRMVILVFYFSYNWTPCKNQLVGLANDYTKYEEKGAQIIALAVQPQDEAALSVERTEAQYPILADSEHTVADKYGVYNLFSDSEAAASVFIISQDGRIVWDHIATKQIERVRSQTILENMP